MSEVQVLSRPEKKFLAEKESERSACVLMGKCYTPSAVGDFFRFTWKNCKEKLPGSVAFG
jgi:hypothetical protein